MNKVIINKLDCREASIDQLGRVCLPKDFLRKLGWELSTKDCINKVTISLEDDSVVITQDLGLKCSNCNAEVKPGYKFCPYCGGKLNE